VPLKAETILTADDSAQATIESQPLPFPLSIAPAFQSEDTEGNSDFDEADTLPETIRNPARTDFYRKVYCILGLPVDAVTVDQATEKLQAFAAQGERCFLSTPNLNFLIGSRSDASFRDSVIRSDMSVADGMPLVWIARALGIPVRERVAGSSLFERMRENDKFSLSVYFFGGPEGSAARAADAVNSKSGCMKCVGHQYPGYGSVDEISRDEMIRKINECNPDFLVVAMGAKKGQAWIEHNLHRINAPVISHLGAVVNFLAGKISRAPRWAQRSGLEWLWRIKEEPALWKRYFHDGTAFVTLLLSKVIPCVWHRHFHGISQQRFKQSKVSLERLRYACKITLQGPWNETNLDKLRKALTEAVRVPSDIILDVYEVDYVDSACIALFTLLYGHQSKAGQRIRFEGLTASVERAFKVHCVEFLLRTNQAQTFHKPQYRDEPSATVL
jgi:N-acetylglucosaminyldiphosphoundecaprenol N-acetyl-beta-D-mannosaminyltransferase